MKKILCAITLMILVACAYGLDLEKSQFSLSKELANMGYVASPSVGVNIPQIVKAELPTAYDLRDVGGVSYVKDPRSQDPQEHPYVGWAFAAAAAAESSYMMKNNGKSSYFSVLNIINRNPLAGYISMDSFNANSLNSIVGYFQNLTGPIKESDDPYKEPFTSPEVQPEAVAFINNVSYLSDDTVRGFDSEEIAVIKNNIINNGAVYMTHYMSSDYLTSDYKYCYCNLENAYPIHGVAIIGWDDEFDKTKFAIEPEDNGAFLVVNSASHWLLGNEYVWVSYYDTSLSQATAFDCVAKKDAFYNDRISYNKLPMQGGMEENRYGKIVYTATTSGEITGIRPYFTCGGEYRNSFTIQVNDGEEVTLYVNNPVCFGYKSEELETPIYYNKDDIITVYCEYNIDEKKSYKNVLPIESVINIGGQGVIPTVLRNTNFASMDGGFYSEMIDYNIAFSLLVQRRDVTISIDKETLEMHPRDVETIKETVKGTDEKEVIWESSNEDVVTVNEKGVVTAIAEGEAIVSATTVDGKVTANCHITVTNVIAEKLELNKSTLKLDTGYTATLKAIITPKNTTFNTVTWSSSNPEIAIVDKNGKVKGLKEGTCTIIAAIPDGLIAECKVTVKNVDVTSVKLNKEEATIDTSSSVKLVATVLPKRATYKTVKWESSNKKIATVSTTGLVKGVYPGKVTIKASTSNGMYAECEVTVKNIPVKSISLNKTTLKMETRTTAKLVVKFNPSNASYKDITWTSSNTKIATVNSRGTVSSKSIGGKVTITATSKNGKKANCVVTVKTVPVTDVKLNKSKVDLNLIDNKTSKLVATVIPSNATVQAVTWSSSNTKVATVTATGVVKAVGSGSCVVIVKTKDGGYIKTCRVNVKGISVDSVVLNESIVATNVGEKTQLKVTISPKNATNKNVTWSSSNTKILKVDKNGLVTAIGVGKATIKVVSQDSGVSDTCRFTVKK